MHRAIRYLLATILTGCATAGSPLDQPLPRGVSLQFREEYYGFTAANAGEVAEALSRFGPELAGERVPAVSRQELHWDYQLSETNGECRLKSAEVRLDITVVLPEWLDVAVRPAALQARWQDFEEAVRRHEDGHVSLYLEGARDLLRRIQRVPPGVCDTVQGAVDEQGRLSMEDYGERQSAYDRDTRGGQTQGVCWAGPGRIC